ncbi:MAG: DUF6655 family protein [Stellaceae bacterium]
MRFAIAVTLAFLLASCTTMRQTEPQRTATEEMLISSAADRAVGELKLDVNGKAVFVDASNYKGLDAEYTIAAVHALILKDGARLTADRKVADLVVEMRNGAQSIDKREFLIGIPSFDVPIPLAGSLTFPEIALYSRKEDIGVSKLTVADYSNATGASIGASGPVYGFSHDRQYKVLLFIGWKTQDFRPDEDAGTSKGD